MGSNGRSGKEGQSRSFTHSWADIMACYSFFSPSLLPTPQSFTPSFAMSVALTPGINSTRQPSRKLYYLVWPGYFSSRLVISSGLSKYQVWGRKTKSKPKRRHPIMWSWALGCLIPRSKKVQRSSRLRLETSDTKLLPKLLYLFVLKNEVKTICDVHEFWRNGGSSSAVTKYSLSQVDAQLPGGWRGYCHSNKLT